MQIEAYNTFFTIICYIYCHMFSSTISCPVLLILICFICLFPFSLIFLFVISIYHLLSLMVSVISESLFSVTQSLKSSLDCCTVTITSFLCFRPRLEVMSACDDLYLLATTYIPLSCAVNSPPCCDCPFLFSCMHPCIIMCWLIFCNVLTCIYVALVGLSLIAFSPELKYHIQLVAFC